MYNNYQELFNNILKRIHSESNKEKYEKFLTQPRNYDEERLFDLCQKFWTKDCFSESLDEYYFGGNSAIEDAFMRQNLIEINKLLDKLGWEKS